MVRALRGLVLEFVHCSTRSELRAAPRHALVAVAVRRPAAAARRQQGRELRRRPAIVESLEAHHRFSPRWIRQSRLGQAAGATWGYPAPLGTPTSCSTIVMNDLCLEISDTLSGRFTCCKSPFSNRILLKSPTLS